MLPLIVTAASTSKGMLRYIKTAKKVANDVEFLFIEFKQNHPNEINGRPWMVDFPNARRIKFGNVAYPGHPKKYLWIKKIFEKFGYARQYGRWVMFTDTDDVIFQTAFPEVDPAKKIYVASEGLTFGESDFWPKILKKNIAFRPIMDRMIYNSGTVMMRMDFYMDWLNFIAEKLTKKSFQGWANDQPLLNLWLSKIPDQFIGEHPSLMTPLYKNLEDGRIIKTKKGVFVNKAKVPYTIIHANGSMKKFLDK